MKENKLNYLFLVCVSILVLLGASYTTTPLFDTYSTDSAIFMLIGKAMVRGKKLYVDIWDHKGPVLFFFQALGMTGGKIGIFVLQSVLFSVSTVFLYKTAKLVASEKNAFISTVFIILCMIPSIAGGNLCEEYSFPFVVISFYLATKYITSDDVVHNCLYSVVYGICFAAVAFIRINNAVIICASVLAICIVLIQKKQYAQIFKNALYLIAGVLIVVVPLFVYFIINDSLYDMLYATFIFNFKYTAHVGTKASIVDRRNELIYLIPLALTTVALFFRKDKKLFIMSAVNTFAVGFVLFMGKSYLHYFYWVYPIALLGVAAISKNFSKPKLLKIVAVASVCIYLVFCAVPAKEVLNRIASAESYKTEKAEIVNAFSKIDKEKRIFGYNMTANDMLVADFIPCFKYFTLQDWWTKSDSAVGEEINEMLVSDTPDYIVVPKSGTENEFLNNFVKEKGTPVSETEKLQIYSIIK